MAPRTPTSPAGTPTGARAARREELTRAIVDRATEQLAEVGPAAISVRQVARDLDLASSAVYRYFPSRDALLTTLIIEAYGDLADAVEAAVAGATATHGPHRLDLRWRALGHAVHDWARAQPHRWALLYGSPVPGYAAPVDTVSPSGRVTTAVLEVARDAQVAGCTPPGALPVPPAERAALAGVVDVVTPALRDDVAVRAAMTWSTLVGQVSLELFGHLEGGILDHDAHLAQVVDQLGADLGLTRA